MAGSIGDLVVRIRGDNSQLDKAVDASKKQFDKVAKSAADFGRQMSNVDKLASVLGKEVNVLSEKHALLRKRIEELINSGINPASKEIKDLATQYKSLGAQIDQAGAKAKRLESLKTLGQTLSNLGKTMSLMVTAPIVALGVAAVKSSADMEMMEAAFTTMLGSADKAKGLLGELREMAAATPFQLTDLADASKTLLAFGFDAEKLLPTIEMLGDVSQGNSQRFKSLSLAFAQVQSTGRLMGQDLLQMVNVGFNPLQIMSEQTGKSMADLKKEMEQGAISADMVTDALRSATSEGGRFFGGMALASKTLSGLWSTLMDTMAEFGRSLADMLLPTIKDIIKTLTGWLTKFTSLDAGTKKFILGVVAVVAAIGPLALGIGKLIPLITSMAAAIAASNFAAMASGIGLAVAALGILTAGVATYVKAIKETREEQSRLNDEFKSSLDLGTEFAHLFTEEGKAVAAASKEVQEVTKRIAELTKILKDAADNPFVMSQAQLDNIAKAKKELGDLQAKLVELTASPETKADMEAMTKAWVDIADGIARVAREEDLALAVGEEYNAIEQRREVLIKAIQELQEKGFRIEGDGIQAILAANKDILKDYQDQEGALRLLVAAENAKADAAEKAAQDAQVASDFMAEYTANLERMKAEEEALAAVEAENSAQRRAFYLQQYSDSDQAVIAITEEKEAYIASGIERAEAEAWAQAEIDKVRTDEAEAEKKRIQEIADAHKAANQKILDTAFATASQLTDLAQAIIDRRLELFTREIEAQEEIYQGELDWIDDRLEAEQKYHDEATKLLDDYDERQEESYQAAQDRTDALLKADLERIDAELRAALEAAGVAEETKMERLQRELDEARAAGDTETAAKREDEILREQITAEYEALRKAAEEKADAEKEAREQAYEEAKEAREIARQDRVEAWDLHMEELAEVRAAREIELAEDIDKKKRRLAREAAIASRVTALFNIAINTAQAIMAALATPFVGPVLAVAAGVAGAIQAAIVAAQPLPALAEGAIVLPKAGGVPVTVAEAKQPEVIFPLDRLEDFVSSWPGGGAGGESGDIRLQVMLDSRPILEKIFPATRNRTVLIDARSVV